MRIYSAPVRIMDGAKVFSLMDSEGLPFEVIQDELAHEGMAFNVYEFCQAARASGNYSAPKLFRLLKEHAPSDEAKRLSAVSVMKAYGIAHP